MNRKALPMDMKPRLSLNERGDEYLSKQKAEQLYKVHLQGAYVRTGSCLFIWVIILCSFLLRIIQYGNFIGLTACVFLLIVINPPTLMILKHVRNKRIYFMCSVLINVLEIVGYTGIIYFVGGINAIYLSIAYAALISYVGSVAPKKFPFIIATFCSLSILSMVILEYFGFIPHQTPQTVDPMPLTYQLGIALIVIALLFIVAYITSYTSNLLRTTKHKLQVNNRKLEDSKAKLVKIAENLRAKNRELKTAVKKAEELDKVKSEFIANMSHELRTPLNHIIGFSELIVDGKVGELNKEQQEFLGDVLSSAKHLLSLINDILDISKIEAGHYDLEFSYIDFKRLIEKSTLFIKEHSLNKGLEIQTNIADFTGLVSGDERKLRQVLYNLLSNAVKFSSKGGKIELTAKSVMHSETGSTMSHSGNQDAITKERGLKSSEEYSVNHRATEVDVLNKNSFIEVSVQDSGFGIDQKDLERIFEPFVQVDGSMSKKAQGTGLGLAICKNIIEAHGGKIWAESSGKQCGSKFVFTIPIEGEIPG